MNYARTVACAIMVIVVSRTHAASLNIDMPGLSIPVNVTAGYSGATVTLSGPNGLVVQRQLDSTNGNRFKLDDVVLVEGQYHYRIDLAGKTAAGKSGSSEDGRAAVGTVSAATLAPAEGSFRYEGGHAFVATALTAKTDGGSTPGGSKPADVVTADDIIIMGSACIGLDCVSDEAFGFDTLRLKENNTRIHFFDTSSSPGFANTNWQLTANDSVSGGLNKFSIEDLTAATVPFTVVGAAPNNAIYVDSTGRVGLRTSTPALDLHLFTGNTPAIRLDQSNASGFTAQTWDVAGNEANFFVRDVTGGSRLPLRIRPGAPTSSIDINANGNVGFGTASPSARLHAVYSTALNSPVPVLRLTNIVSGLDVSQQDRFVVDSSGNVLARGTLSQLSSRATKENFAAADGAMLLAKLEKMPISSWNYRGAPIQERHVGPVAEDFHAAFGLGQSERYVAPTDMAGVALASVQALQQEIKQRDQHIEQLEERLRALETRLDAAAH